MKFPQRFFHRAHVNVPVEVAWDVFTDHERLGEFASSACQITKEGSPERNGLGCVRLLGAPEQGIPEVVEVVNFWHPNELFGYHVTAGAPLSHHQGIIRFFSHGERETEWVYDMRCIVNDETLEARPNIYDELIDGFKTYMKDLEAECERRGSLTEITPPSEPIPLSVHGGQLS